MDFIAPKRKHHVCKIVKNHAEAWKILDGKPLGFFQELKATKLLKCLNQSTQYLFNIFLLQCFLTFFGLVHPCH